jgi:hypothetical protein
MRPKDIGTRYETAVVKYLLGHGFPHAERRALAGAADLGDITGTPGIMWECKAGQAAYNASDGQVEAWLEECERQRMNARADIGVLVMDRRSYGLGRAGQTWAVFHGEALAGPGHPLAALGVWPVRMHLESAVLLLRGRGYGDALGQEGS